MIGEEDNDDMFVRDYIIGRKKIRFLNKTKLSKEELENYFLDMEEEL